MSMSESVGIPQSPPPDVLYKYLPPERIDILENMELRFNSPAEFNDTFDSYYLVPRSEGPKGTLARLRLRRQLGILCLTEEPNNHLMWVHYARNHTGFVLGFNARAPFFQANHRVLGKVHYEPSPKVVSAADMNVCFYKSDEWVYEKEWRCVRSFERSESRVATIEPELVTHVIFGSRMEAWQIARILQYVTAFDMAAHTQFLLSSPLSKSWTFENRPKKMSVCSICDGNGYLMED